MKAPRDAAALPHGEQAGADSVDGFARRHAISRAQAFKEIAEGRLIGRKVGSRTIITCEDAAAWRRRLPKAKANDASRVETPTAKVKPETAVKTAGGQTKRAAEDG